MRRLAAALGALALLAALLALAGRGGATNLNLRAALSDAIAREPVVDLATLTPFRWTAVYFFRPEAAADEVNASLGFEWSAARTEAPLPLGRRPLLLFVDGRRVVRLVDYANGAARTDCLQGTGFARSQARFLVVRPEMVLVPAVRSPARQRRLVAQCLAQVTPR